MKIAIVRLEIARASPLPDLMRRNFWTFITFLQEKGLTTRMLANSSSDLTEDFAIWPDDLTQKGIEFYAAAEGAFLDVRIDPADYEVSLKRVSDKTRFERVLAKLEKKAAAKQATKTAAAATAAMPLETIKLRIGKPADDETGGDDDLYKYDDASWHSEAGLPADLPDEAGGTHIGMFLAWAALGGLGSEDLLDDFADDIDALRTRSITPGAFARAIDGRLTTEELSRTGNAFARNYYGSHYLDDYAATLGASRPSLYHVADNWENFDRLKPVLDSRFEAWKLALS